MIYRTDYHLHTLYSDGEAWPEDYISSALKAGLSELGFSDHIVLNDKNEEWSMDPSLLDEYCKRLIKLNTNTGGLKVRIGLEVDYLPGKEEDIRNLIDSYPLDYVIGSVHFLSDESVDSSPGYYHDKNPDALWEEYFYTLEKAAASGIFNFIGHLDLVRIFGFSPPSNPEKLYRKLAIAIKKSGVAVELNTNGVNKPLSDFYPDRRFLHIFSEENVPACVNSDAHMPDHTAQYFDEAYSLMIEAGYKEMVVFKNRKMSMIKLS